MLIKQVSDRLCWVMGRESEKRQGISKHLSVEMLVSIHGIGHFVQGCL